MLSDLSAEFGHSYNYWDMAEAQCLGENIWETILTT